MWKPSPGNVFVKKVKLETGNIIIPETAKCVEPVVGEVVAVCDFYSYGDKVLEPEIKVGDLVVYNPLHSIKFEVDGNEFVSTLLVSIIAYNKKE